jgi:hypothetical protein
MLVTAKPPAIKPMACPYRACLLGPIFCELSRARNKKAQLLIIKHLEMARVVELATHATGGLLALRLPQTAGSQMTI